MSWTMDFIQASYFPHWSPFSVPGSNPGSHVALSCHVPWFFPSVPLSQSPLLARCWPFQRVLVRSLVKCPSIWVYRCFLGSRWSLCIFWQEYSRSSISQHIISGVHGVDMFYYWWYQPLSLGDVNLNHLVNGFLNITVTVLSSVINPFLGGDTLRPSSCPVCPHALPTNFNIHSQILPVTITTVVFV